MEWITKWLMSLSDGQEDFVLAMLGIIILSFLFIAIYIAVKKRIRAKKNADGSKEIVVEDENVPEKIEPAEIKKEEVKP